MHKLQAYGISASCIEDEISIILGEKPENHSFESQSTGEIKIQPEIYSSLGGSYIPHFGASSIDGVLFCVIIIIVLMALFAVIWAIVMLAFSIMTIGGFIKRRYRTLVFIEKEHKPFIGKLAVLSVDNEGVINYHLGFQHYDEWVDNTFGLFERKKYIRQLALFFGVIWGIIEVGFKLNQLLLNPAFSYNLWPFRLVMVAIFLPLLFYAPILEIQFRNAFDEGRAIVDRLLIERPEYSISSAREYWNHHAN